MDIPIKYCKYCKDKTICDVVPHDSHVLAYKCPKCLRFNDYPKKENSTNNNRESKHRELVKKYSKGFCEICRIKDELIPKPQTMEAHHIISHKDGGSSDRDNIIILCTWCHKQIEQIITYKNHFLDTIQSNK